MQYAVQRKYTSSKKSDTLLNKTIIIIITQNIGSGCYKGENKEREIAEDSGKLKKKKKGIKKEKARTLQNNLERKEAKAVEDK